MSDEITPRREERGPATAPSWPNDLRLPIPEATRYGGSDAVLRDREELVQAIFRVKSRLNYRLKYWLYFAIVMGIGLILDVVFYFAYEDYQRRAMWGRTSRSWYQDDAAWCFVTVVLVFLLLLAPPVYWVLFRWPIRSLKSILMRLRATDARIMPQFVDGATHPNELTELGWEFLHAFEGAYLPRTIPVRLRLPASSDGQSNQQWRVFLDGREVGVMAEVEGFDQVVDTTLGSHVLALFDIRDVTRFHCNHFVLVRARPCLVDGRHWRWRTSGRPMPVEYLSTERTGEGAKP